jgi:hypothetical protein
MTDLTDAQARHLPARGRSLYKAQIGIRGSSMRKLPRRYQVVALPFVLSVLMSCIVSGITTLRIGGFDQAFFSSWMSAWGLSWLVAFPAVLVVLPVARRIVGLVVESHAGP